MRLTHEQQEIIDRNRERWSKAFAELGKYGKHSRYYYFAGPDGEPASQYDPEGQTCPNGLALIAMGVRNLTQFDEEAQDRVIVSLGYGVNAFAKIDAVNRRHEWEWMLEYMNQEVFAENDPAYMELTEEKIALIREIPDGFSFETPDGAINWYYCPSCGEWLYVNRTVTSRLTEQVSRHMQGGHYETDNDTGNTRYWGGKIQSLWIEGKDLREPEVTILWTCMNCGMELPEAYSRELNAARFTREGQRIS